MSFVEAYKKKNITANLKKKKQHVHYSKIRKSVSMTSKLFTIVQLYIIIMMISIICENNFDVVSIIMYSMAHCNV